MRKNVHGNRYHAVASDGALDFDHPLNRGRVLWMLPGVPGVPSVGTRLLNLADPKGQTHGTLAGFVQGAGSGWQGASGIQFDGSDDAITASLPITNTKVFALAISARTTDSSASTHYLTSQTKAASTTAGDFFGIRLNTGLYTGRWQSTGGTTNLTIGNGLTYSDGLWHRLLLTGDGTTLSFYVDGLLAATGAFANTIATQDAFNIGRFSSGDGLYYTGLLRDHSAWTRGLSSGEAFAENNLSRQGYRVPDSPLRWISTRTYSVPASTGITRYVNGGQISNILVNGGLIAA